MLADVGVVDWVFAACTNSHPAPETSFVPTAAELDLSLYLNYEPSSNPPNLDTHRSCAGYDLPTPSGPKRRNSGGGDDQGRGKKYRSGNDNNNNMPPGGDGAGGGGNDGGSPEENDISNTTGNTPPPKHFACPFYKLDPEKHKKRCAHPVLTSWSRVFQHINRVHVPKIEHCPKCRLTFPGKDGENLKNAHCRLDSCQPADILQTGILLTEEYNNLKNIRAKSEEEKWIKGWYKLFPHLEAPWPLFETYHEFILRTAQPICLTFLQQAQGQNDLVPLATKLTEALARTFTPALRVESCDATSTQAMQALGSGPASGQPFAQPQQVPPELSAQVQHAHPGISAQEPFNPDAFQYGQQTQTQSLPGSDLADAVPQQDFSVAQTPFDVRENLRGIGANLPTPILFPGDSYIQDEDGMFWGFPTDLLPDSGN